MRLESSPIDWSADKFFQEPELPASWAQDEFFSFPEFPLQNSCLAGTTEQSSSLPSDHGIAPEKVLPSVFLDEEDVPEESKSLRRAWKIRKARPATQSSGCKCTKNSCGNNYCTCHRGGRKCGKECQCRDCNNHSFVRTVSCRVEEAWLHAYGFGRKQE